MKMKAKHIGGFRKWKMEHPDANEKWAKVIFKYLQKKPLRPLKILNGSKELTDCEQRLAGAVIKQTILDMVEAYRIGDRNEYRVCTRWILEKANLYSCGWLDPKALLEEIYKEIHTLYGYTFQKRQELYYQYNSKMITKEAYNYAISILDETKGEK